MTVSPTESTFAGVWHEHQAFLGALDAGTSVHDAVAEAYGWDLEAPIPEMIVGQIDQIVIRRLNDFVPDSEAPVILDCGANIGISSLHFKRCFPKARIVAFEPDPVLFSMLRRNLTRNNASDIEALEAAVWLSTGEMSFASDGVDGGRLEPESAGSAVRTVDLNTYLDKPVDLLKLDVEGAEYPLLRHVHRRLGRVKNIVVECHINQTTLPQFGTLLQRLRRAGFHVAFDTFGYWRDLVRGGDVDRFHFEQYVAVYGRRTMTSAALPSSCLPYLDVPTLLEFYRSEHAHDAPKRYRESQRGSMAALRNAPKIKVERPFIADGGRGWRVALPAEVGQGDTLDHPSASRLILCENDRPIGPPHSQHSVIRRYGGGRFSHWHTSLYFSTSDDSDPNKNRRTYSVVQFNESSQGGANA